MRYIAVLLISTAIIFAGGEVPPQLDPYNPPYEPGVVLVKLKDDVQVNRDQLARSVNPSFGVSSLDLLNLEFELSTAEKIFTQAETRSVAKMIQMPQGYIEAPNLHNIYRLSFDEALSVEMMVQAYSEDPNVEYAEPDYLMRMMETTPDDPMYSQQWHHAAVNAPALWDSTTGDTSQIIGIIDTGVDWDHPDLAENIWINWVEYHGAQGVDDDGNGFVDDIRGWDWISNDNDPNDDNAHGTHVAGIAAATGNNGIGVTGVSWNSKIMCLKVLQSTGYGNSSDVAAAVEYAGNNGATVMNLSLGSYGHSQVLENALAVAYNTTIEVAAAGNDGRCIGPGGSCAPMFPACFSWVLGVQAVSLSGEDALFSNFDQDGPQASGYQEGYNYELKAPGVSIYSSFPSGGYHSLNGTSMASPVIAGGVANILAYDEPISTELFRAKLITSSGNNVDLFATLTAPEPDPVLNYVSHTIVDTCDVCDNDGRADAGETIEIWFIVKNYGGYADSVTVTLDFAEFEDTTTATIIEPSGYMGDISCYSELDNRLFPVSIYINENIPHARDIRLFPRFESGSFSYPVEVLITAENGIEVSGIITEDMVWTADKQYIINNSFRVGEGATLTVMPGTHIIMYPDMQIGVRGNLIANGTPDSMIVFQSDPRGIGLGITRISGNSTDTLRYCLFEGIAHPLWGGKYYVEYCVFNEVTTTFSAILFSGEFEFFHNEVKNSSAGVIFPFSNANIQNNTFHDLTSWYVVWYSLGQDFRHNNLYNVNSTWNSDERNGAFYLDSDHLEANPNNIVSCYNVVTTSGSEDVVQFPSQYWGTVLNDNIQTQIMDFWDYSGFPQLDVYPILQNPDSLAHGIVWKIDVNGIDPQDEELDYLGPDTHQFDVYFNRAMDTDFEPFLTFGVDQPYTQHVVNDSASWSADSSVWTAYTTMGIETGDGINRVRVSGARDDENFEIPIEDQRFEFVLQAAGAASVQFIATPGIGKVDLEWPPASTDDALGYNMYRSLRLNDSTWASYEMINDILITDSTYIDFVVIPDSTYRYQYTVLGTDFSESDPSKVISSTPFSAANGDANGDLAVNVLDIISMVSYVLEGDPQPFLFDAADLNGDDQVNVLDIIGVINIILGGTPKQTSGLPLAEAGVSLDEGELWVSSQTPIAGMQFTFTNASEDVRLSSSYPVEIGTKLDDENNLTVILYSLKGEVVPSGAHEVLTIGNGENLQLKSMLLSTSQGQEIPSRQGLPEEVILPEEYVLKQNYPNPFNASTTIEYAVPKTTDIKMTIYNIRGQEVFSRHQGSVAPGWYSFTWDGYDGHGLTMASGLYLYRFEAEGFAVTHKMLLLK